MRSPAIVLPASGPSRSFTRRTGLTGLGCLTVLLAVIGCGTLGREGRNAALTPPDQNAEKASVAVKSVESPVPAPAVGVNPLPPGTKAVVAVDAQGTNTVSGTLVDETGPYQIHAGDTIHLQVTGEDELSGDFKVSADGKIVLSLLGRTRVEGMTVVALEQSLTAALAKDYLVNPKVYVQVRSSVVRRVILFGEVKSPGVYELPVGDRFTLLQLIAKAGGFTDVAAPERVRVVRRGNNERAIKVNVADLLRGRGQDADIELQPNDVITVPQSIF